MDCLGLLSELPESANSLLEPTPSKYHRDGDVEYTKTGVVQGGLLPSPEYENSRPVVCSQNTWVNCKSL